MNIAKVIYSYAILLLTFAAHLQGITLGDMFKEAKPGDYAVIAHEYHVTFFNIAKKDESELVVNEVTASQRHLENLTWKQWLKQGAPQASSFVTSTFDAKTLQLISMYSHLTNETSAQGEASFLSSLFRSPLVKVPQDERKKIGPAPLAGELDLRKVWTPKIVYEEKEKLYPTDAYLATLASDDLNYVGKRLVLYFPVGTECLSYFPYWIELGTGITKVKLRVLDSGRNYLFQGNDQILQNE